METSNIKIVKKGSFKLNATPYVIGAKGGKTPEEPQISIKRNNEYISGIDVKCVCGRTINIECQ